MDKHNSSHLTLDKGSNFIHWIQNSLFANFYSKCINDFNIRPETLKLLQENTGKSLQDMGTSRGFLEDLSMKYSIRIYKLDFIKLNFFHYSEGRDDRVEK